MIGDLHSHKGKELIVLGEVVDSMYMGSQD